MFVLVCFSVCKHYILSIRLSTYQSISIYLSMHLSIIYMQANSCCTASLHYSVLRKPRIASTLVCRRLLGKTFLSCDYYYFFHICQHIKFLWCVLSISWVSAAHLRSESHVYVNAFCPQWRRFFGIEKKKCIYVKFHAEFILKKSGEQQKMGLRLRGKGTGVWRGKVTRRSAHLWMRHNVLYKVTRSPRIDLLPREVAPLFRGCSFIIRASLLHHRFYGVPFDVVLVSLPSPSR